MEYYIVLHCITLCVDTGYADIRSTQHYALLLAYDVRMQKQTTMHHCEHMLYDIRSIDSINDVCRNGSRSIDLITDVLHGSLGSKRLEAVIIYPALLILYMIINNYVV